MRILQGMSLGAAALALSACHVGELLKAPIPDTVVNPAALHSAPGAEALRAGVVIDFTKALGGTQANLIEETGLLSDELSGSPSFSQPDAADRRSQPELINDSFRQSDFVATDLYSTRLQAILAIAPLRQYVSQNPWEVAEMFSLMGYTELWLAENYCSGIPLSQADAKGNIVYGMPLPPDSVYAIAIAHFDSALALAGDTTSILNLARVGRGRALLDIGQFAAADSAVSAVPAGFSYVANYSSTDEPSLFDPFGLFFAAFTVTSVEGGNGLPFLALPADPRVAAVAVGTSFLNSSDTIWYPGKYVASGGPIVIADAIEARLIRAEAQLQAGDAAGWLTTLNNLRDSSGLGLSDIADPGTPSAQVDTMFTERAYWLFATGHRMSDMRRLVRQYGRDQSTVFPVGAYPAGLGGGQYGSDVTFPMPRSEHNNPNFHGCLDRNA